MGTTLWEPSQMRIGLLISKSRFKIYLPIAAKFVSVGFRIFTKLSGNKPSFPLRLPLFHPLEYGATCRITSPILSVSSSGFVEMYSFTATNSETTKKLNYTFPIKTKNS